MGTTHMAWFRPQNISIKHKLLLFTGLVIVACSMTFSAVSYVKQKRALLRGIDASLLIAAHLAEQAPAEGYFDRIEDVNSVPESEYLRIVATHNRLCRELGLQYLWSCLLLDGKVVFTTATSPSKDVRTGDHAGFLDAHRDPHAFDGVFATMEPDYSSFHNQWGHGRMVLVPRLDSRRRPYCFGASISIDHVHNVLRAILRDTAMASLAILLAGVVASFLVSDSLAKPVIRLAAAADRIAQGRFGEQVQEGGYAELVVLSESIAKMSLAIQGTVGDLQLQVDERRAAEAELERHRDQLEGIVQTRTAALQQSNDDLQQFAYVASHDLREPLHTIGGFAELLERRYKGRLDSEADEFIGYIVDAVYRMDGLIHGLLEYSRVGTRGKAPEPAPCDEALADALANLRAAIDEAGATVTQDALPNLSIDRAQVTQLFQNLIANAIKFRGQNPPRVHVSASSGDTEWTFAVRDNGVGISPDSYEHVFTIFGRLHPPEEYPGFGIGLAFCKRIAQRHGGRIWVESKPGEGSTFYFTLPTLDDRSPGGE